MSIASITFSSLSMLIHTYHARNAEQHAKTGSQTYCQRYVGYPSFWARNYMLRACKRVWALYLCTCKLAARESDPRANPTCRQLHEGRPRVGANYTRG